MFRSNRVLDKSGKPVPHVYCIGDANGKLMLAHAASAQASLFSSFCFSSRLRCLETPRSSLSVQIAVMLASLPWRVVVLLGWSFTIMKHSPACHHPVLNLACNRCRASQQWSTCVGGTTCSTTSASRQPASRTLRWEGHCERRSSAWNRSCQQAFNWRRCKMKHIRH